MHLLESAFLGIVQGLAEFLPISSSGHLALLHHFFGVRNDDLAFDVVLHLGTLTAVVFFFWAEWKQVFRSGIRLITRWKVETDWDRLTLYLIIATIPGAIFGKLLESKAETAFRSPWLVALALAVMGLVLLWAERVSTKKRDLTSMKMKEGVIIGLAQALALIPGVSRSGATMTTALFQGFNREAAARFSFLLSAPIIAGAGVSQASSIAKDGSDATALIIGFVTSLIAGLFAIRFLLNYLRNHSFAVFAYYRLVLAGAVVLLLLGGA